MAALASSSLVSAVISAILSVVIFASLRFFNAWFTESPLNTLLGGYAGSWLFIFVLTSVSNIEMVVFGDDFQAFFMPEIVLCLLISIVACGSVHRVCATSCILFSIVALYFVQRISTEYHSKGRSIAVEQQVVNHRKGGGKKHKQ